VNRPDALSRGYLFLIDKPEGLTSHDVVERVRKATALSRIGHSGTLDPMATGLLLLCAGGAARLQGFPRMTADADITRGVQARLSQELPLSQVGVRTGGGTVALTGVVATIDVGARASELARGVPGVRSVTNELTYDPANRPAVTMRFATFFGRGPRKRPRSIPRYATRIRP